ncbi:MAG: hypothetical protein P8077_03180 [Gammaproteobacteria bacterium]
MNSQHFKKKHSFYLDVILALQHIGALPASTVIPLASPGARSTTRPPRIHAHHTFTLTTHSSRKAQIATPAPHGCRIMPNHNGISSVKRLN